MTPENFTDDQIRELVPELTGFSAHDINSLQDFQNYSLNLLLTTRLELKEARDQLVSHGLTSKSVVSHQPAPPETQAPSLAGKLAKATADNQPILIDRLNARIAELEGALKPFADAFENNGKRTLDLKRAILHPGTWDQRVSLSELLRLIRAQLPDVEVIV